MHVDVNQGLSHNEVLCFYKDRQGFLWVGTAFGISRYDGYGFKVFQHDARDSTTIATNLIQRIVEVPGGRLGVVTADTFNVYDPAKEHFVTNADAFFQAYRLPRNRLRDVVKDATGNFWFIHTSAGLVRYDTTTRQSLSLRHVPGDTTTIASDSVTSFLQDAAGRYWVMHANGTLERIVLRRDGCRVDYRNKTLRGARLDYHMVADPEGDLWIFAQDEARGVYHFQPTSGTLQHYTATGPEPRLSTNLVRALTLDDRGRIWIGTDHGGINILDKKNRTVQTIVNHEDDPKSLRQNSINALYRDDQGIIWIGTYKRGISYYHKNLLRFPRYGYMGNSPGALPFSDVNRFVEDDRGNLWIGTNGGGLIYFNRTTGGYTTYKNIPGDPRSLSNNVIVSLCIDHRKTLWIGTYLGGLNSFDGTRFTRYTHNPADPSSLAAASVWEIFEDSRQRLWIGTLNGGLDLLDTRTNTFAHYKTSDPQAIHSDYIAAITEDREGNVWIGTSLGIDVLSRERGRFIHYENEKNNPGSLSNNNVYDIREDAAGRIWVGTAGGLNLYDKKSRTFRAFTVSDGLPHNAVLTLLEDDQGHLWMSTPNGLSQLELGQSPGGKARYTFRNYGEAEGLQAKQFNENAALKTRRGELVFGGASGFNIFKPGQLGRNTTPPRVVLTDFQLFNKSIRPDESVDGTILLPASITESEAIVLPPDKNVFSIEFAALNFFHPENNTYLYTLEGFDNGWLPADSRSRRVTFTNLDPGEYTFRVKAANNDGVWNEQGARLRITVLPPFWKTRTALLLYFLFIIAALLVTRKLIQQREQMKFMIEQERQEANRMHELDMMKLKFFTNVSHEFRTPLTLILTPLEKMLRQATEPAQRQQFQVIQRNARRLLSLVNQLLDFRKLEVQEVKFNPSEGDIVAFIRDTVYSFSDLSEKKDIRLDFHTGVAALETIFDQDKLEKILFNLLSNAFKFTPEHGAVTVTVALQPGEGAGRLIIRVQDTGIGIPADKQEKIFERFFQHDLPKSIVNQGSGIGLSITREFVKIHGGTIAVQSEPGVGSTFTVTLPLHEVTSGAAESVQPGVNEQIEEVVGQPALAEIGESAGKKPVLLLVEDNEDFRFYLKDNLRLDYQVLEARNGREGWKKVQEQLPDLVVSDIMMPEMNGIELCRNIKTDQRVSHTPVILLTARAAEEQKLEGFQTGADDYITKPFNFEILASRIRNLIARREKFHQAFPRQLDVRASELQITPLDEKFIQNAIKCVEDNIASPEFSVEDLSRQLGISRAHFYKKILALTGKSPLEFIRTIRLQQAAQLLEKSQLTVAEVAYRVGFNNPKYFARYFKEQYDVLPSAYAAGKRKGSA
ncbi:response regulator [Fulvivirgaceae bacterium PWU37]|uniref:histidine kinase n=2 Tax=Dawidia soli TaxID=2782352 RepID=A0AAP2DIB9_9BACT|nr:response regulator [Dawidia soli]